MKDPFEREVTVFGAARRLPPAERAAYLHRSCAGDPALRQRVEELLQAGEEAEGFLQEPAPGADRPEAASASALVVNLAAPGEKAGDRIGRYKLLQQIGEGGCGVVYMAEQEEPVRRRVALKVIKLGMDTKQVIARFEAERQALAMMEHANIAKVLDAGTTETGRPYFAMELVRGIKITDYCDEHNLSTKERLELFMQVCHAVQHAHQKGIIHRDLKPSNILVASDDGVPVPKVIDFGIAKATQGRLTDKTLFTAFEQFIGTPAYMSPEQAELTMQDVDTRTDIYSLGVLLYELLTGRTPFDAQELLASGLDAIRRTIREVEPVKPSTKLTQELVGDDVRSLHSKPPKPKSEDEIRDSSRRLLQKKELIRQLRGDLDWLVMKCLEKDRARRYETANGLANDVRRHLNCEPILARPPSRLYEFQKTVRRHKFGFGATVALILVLAAGVAVSTWEAIRATRAERQQTQLRQIAQENEKRMQTQVAAIIHDFGRGGIVATKILMDVGRLPEAEALTRERLAVQRKSHEKPEELLSTLDLLGTILVRESKLEEATSMYREALRFVKNLEGAQQVVLARVARFQNLTPLLAEGLEARGRLGDAEEIYSEFTTYAQTNSALLQSYWGRYCLSQGGDIYARHGRWKEAVDNFAKFLQIEPTDPRLHHTLAPLLVARQDLEEYQKLCQSIVAHFGGITNPFIADRLAKDCLILPSSGADLDVIGKMADRAVAAGTSNDFFAYFQCTKGLAEYRLGHFAAALNWLGKTIDIGDHRDRYQWDDYLYVEAYAVSSMAHHQLNQSNDARAALAKASEIAGARLPKLESGNVGAIWRDWIIAHALLNEAKALIDSPLATPRK